MNWRDFFYFSKGERRALLFLLFLIIIGWLTLLFTSPGSRQKDSSRVLYPVCIYVPEDLPVKTKEKTIAPVTSQPEERKKESTPAFALPDSLQRKPFYTKSTKVEKYAKGVIVELNTADSVILKKIPGIGSAFSNRIVKYRNLLGGYHSVSQLSEVYGIDEEKYAALKEWFCVNPHLIDKKEVNRLPLDSLARHPYISYRQAKAIKQLQRQKGRLSGWENLLLLEEFSDHDRERMEPYLSFE